MVRFRGDRAAFGWPGIDPKWSRSDKYGVGTAYSATSKVWFTVWRGLVTEVYYPTIDCPQIRDFQFLVTDGKSFFHDEKRGPKPDVAKLDDHSLGYKVKTVDPENRYTLTREIITDPHLPVVLVNTVFEYRNTPQESRLYALCAPHLGGGGRNNSGHVAEVAGKTLLIANNGGAWMAMGSTLPLGKASCGYVGASDGWTDLARDMSMDWEFDEAVDGNIALTAELPAESGREFTIALAFGRTLNNAVTTLLQSLSFPFADAKKRFLEQWKRPYVGLLPLERVSHDQGRLYRSSYGLLRSHEDKSYPGAFIASLSIPWGEIAGDDDKGGYHLVWTRDLVNTSTALLAAGDEETPLRSLVYLAGVQNEDGGFAQNFWIDGVPYWGGIQLDEVSFPVILAWRLWKMNALRDFNPYRMVISAASYIVKKGPVTQQERWEEASGYSPSTLAANIAALVCASEFAMEQGDSTSASYLLDYADFLEGHLEKWTVTSRGELLPGVQRHYIRILPVAIGDGEGVEDPDTAMLTLANVAPGRRATVPARNVVDAGFLELVRYGVRAADNPVIVDSLKVVDSVLKVSTPFGPCWHRYNGDGYGQRDDGSPYAGWGTGRAWPLLTGERAHYELAAGHDASALVEAMERFATPTGLLPEQVWDTQDIPEKHLHLGRPTGSAMPLMWAHAEYIKLLRSLSDGAVFDRVEPVYQRYCVERKTKKIDYWSFSRRVTRCGRDSVIRIQAAAPFKLHWSQDNWVSVEDKDSLTNPLGVFYVDLGPDELRADAAKVLFTFYWVSSKNWEGRDFCVELTG